MYVCMYVCMYDDVEQVHITYTTSLKRLCCFIDVSKLTEIFLSYRKMLRNTTLVAKLLRVSKCFFSASKQMHTKIVFTILGLVFLPGSFREHTKCKSPFFEYYQQPISI